MMSLLLFLLARPGTPRAASLLILNNNCGQRLLLRSSQTAAALAAIVSPASSSSCSEERPQGHQPFLRQHTLSGKHTATGSNKGQIV